MRTKALKYWRLFASALNPFPALRYFLIELLSLFFFFFFFLVFLVGGWWLGGGSCLLFVVGLVWGKGSRDHMGGGAEGVAMVGEGPGRGLRSGR